MPVGDWWPPRDVSEIQNVDERRRTGRYARRPLDVVPDIDAEPDDEPDWSADLRADRAAGPDTAAGGVRDAHDALDGADGQDVHPDDKNAGVLDLESEVEPGLRVRDVLSRFAPERLGLPDMDFETAQRYIEDHVAYRPWLRSAEVQHPLVQRVYAVLDRGHGHLLQRHEGYGGDGAQFERAAYLRDPAQRTELAHLRSVDGFKRRDKQHGCGLYATRIHDPVAFATAVARVQDHPVVRAALEMPYVEGKRPETVESVTLEEVLGPDGHLACSGFVLIGDDPDQARAQRQAWVEAIRQAVPRHSAESVATLADRARQRALAAGLREPRAEPIESFEGGRLRIAFKPNRAKNGYELLTMFASPNASLDKNEEQL